MLCWMYVKTKRDKIRNNNIRERERERERTCRLCGKESRSYRG